MTVQSMSGPVPLGDGSRPEAAERSPGLSVVIGLEGLALGGCPINALDLGRSLRERGHRVNVFAIDEDVRVSLLPYAEQAGFEVTRFPARSGTAARAGQIRRFARHHDADVVHVFAPWLAPAAAIATGADARLAVVTNWTMGNVAYTPRHLPMIVGTRLMQQEARTFHGSRVWLMEPPVDLVSDEPDPLRAQAFRQSHRISHTDTLAVVVSRLDTQMKAEGIINTIRAIGAIARRDLRLAVVGNGDAYDRISREADAVNSGLGWAAVILTGELIDPRPAYSAADITLGMGGSALRCLAHGKPLIVLGENGFARLFDETSMDYFLEFGFFGQDAIPDPVAAIADPLSGLMAGDEQTRLGELGRNLVRSRFSLSRSAEELARIYRAEALTVPSQRTGRVLAGRLLARAVVRETRDAARRSLSRPGRS